MITCEKKMSDYLISTVSANCMAPLDATESASVVMKFGSRLCMEPALKELTSPTD